MISFPNAKINIGLDIVARRPDGYHNLVSVFYPLPWRDVLEIVPAKGTETTLSVSGNPCDCPPEKNLVMKAYRALDLAAGPLPPVDIYLRKIIPDGAGLGGGSADAAFTLRMLNDMFALSLSDTRLAIIASEIGADCTFFIHNRPMLATATGTTLTPVPLSLKGMRIVVVKPQVHVSTREAYAGVTPREPERNLAADILNLTPDQWRGVIKNDFEESIFPAHSEIARIKERLYELGATYASMSGSGSAVYGIFKDDTLSVDTDAEFPGCACLAATLS
nr:4-(cytidine 5'-diphospho)-2-C-methyl-D-erythritol kinase [Bacteroides sp.]